MILPLSTAASSFGAARPSHRAKARTTYTGGNRSRSPRLILRARGS